MITAQIKAQIETAASLAFGAIAGQSLTTWEHTFVDDMIKCPSSEHLALMAA